MRPWYKMRDCLWRLAGVCSDGHQEKKISTDITPLAFCPCCMHSLLRRNCSLITFHTTRFMVCRRWRYRVRRIDGCPIRMLASNWGCSLCGLCHLCGHWKFPSQDGRLSAIQWIFLHWEEDKTCGIWLNHHDHHHQGVGRTSLTLYTGDQMFLICLHSHRIWVKRRRCSSNKLVTVTKGW